MWVGKPTADLLESGNHHVLGALGFASTNVLIRLLPFYHSRRFLMSSITADLIKALREATGAGMSLCKQALEAAGGEIEEAKKWLRTKGIAVGAKKSDRHAGEGVIALRTSGDLGCAIELSCETDFVARNEIFIDLTNKVLEVAFTAPTAAVEDLLEAPFGGLTLREHILEAAGTLGENIVLRRATHIRVNQGVVAGYLHMPWAPGLGKLGVLVGLESAAPADQLQALGKDIGMHIAFNQPPYVDVDSVPEKEINAERDALLDQLAKEGRTGDVASKILDGRMKKFFEQVTLLDQPFVRDDKQTVRDLLQAFEKTSGHSVTVGCFSYLRVGQTSESVQAAASGAE
jgi:elongation factor Ts